MKEALEPNLCKYSYCTIPAAENLCEIDGMR